MTREDGSLFFYGGGGQAATVDPLLAEAALLLRASTYSGSGPWLNEGTLGGAATTVTDNPSAPVWVDGAAPYWDIPITTPGTTNDEHGFTFDDAPELDIAGDRTIAWVTTPDVTGAAGLKACWKYATVIGWVVEEIDDFGGGPGSGGLLIATNDGDMQGGGLVADMISGRQILVARWDTDAGDLTVDRNGEVVINKFTMAETSDISGVAPNNSTAPIRIGAGQQFEALAVWDRVLTDDETAAIPYLLA